jgi:hypothetical protein
VGWSIESCRPALRLCLVPPRLPGPTSAALRSPSCRLAPASPNRRAQKRRLDPGGAGGAPKRSRTATPPASAADAAALQEQLFKVHEVVASLVAHGQAAAAASIVERLAPRVAAELLAHLMAHLPPGPPPEPPGPDFVPAWLSGGAPLGFVRAPGGGPMLLQPLAELPPEPGPPPAALPPEAAGSPPPPAPAPSDGPQRPALLPLPLAPAASSALRQAAVRRILGCPYAAVARMRQLLLARLAAKAAPDDGLGELVLQRVLDDWAAGGGQELAMRWLYALFVAHAGTRRARGSGEDGEEEDDEEEERRLAAAADAAEAAAAAAAEDGGGAGGVKAEAMDVDGGGANGGGGGGRDDAGDVDDLSGTPYEDVLVALLEGLRERLPPEDRSIAGLLLDAPAVPLAPAGAFLRELLEQGADWATAALVAARVLIEGRPPARGAMLEIVLDATAAEAGDVRDLAVKLAVNKLLEREDCAGAIVKFAGEQLARLEAPLGGAGGGEPAAGAKGEDGGEAAAAAAAEAAPEQGASEGAAAAAAEEDAAAAEDGAGAEQQQGGEDAKEAQAEEAADGEAEAEAEAEGEAQMTEADASRLLALYMALCAKRPELLTPFIAAFGRWAPPAQAAAAAAAKALMRVLSVGPLAPELVAAVAEPPEGSVPLLLVMLHALADQRTPQPKLVAAAVGHWKKTGARRAPSGRARPLTGSAGTPPDLQRCVQPSLPTPDRCLPTPHPSRRRVPRRAARRRHARLGRAQAAAQAAGDRAPRAQAPVPPPHGPARAAAGAARRGRRAAPAAATRAAAPLWADRAAGAAARAHTPARRHQQPAAHCGDRDGAALPRVVQAGHRRRGARRGQGRGPARPRGRELGAPSAPPIPLVQRLPDPAMPRALLPLHPLPGPAAAGGPVAAAAPIHAHRHRRAAGAPQAHGRHPGDPHQHDQQGGAEGWGAWGLVFCPFCLLSRMGLSCARRHPHGPPPARAPARLHACAPPTLRARQRTYTPCNPPAPARPARQVWETPQWKGFIMAASKAAPASYDVLLQLPAHALDAALAGMAPEHWPKLQAHTAARAARVPIFQPLRDVVARYAQRAADELKAKIEAAEAEKKAKEEAAAAAAAEAEAGAGGSAAEGGGGSDGGGGASGGGAEAPEQGEQQEQPPPQQPQQPQQRQQQQGGGGGDDEENWTMEDDDE